MYLWNVSRAASALREETVSESEKFQYLLVAAALQSLVGKAALIVRGQTVGGVVVVLAILGVTLWGLWQAFATNQRGDGVRFLERYIVLSVPLTFQFYTLYIVAALTTYLLTLGAWQRASGWSPLLWAVYLLGLVWLFRRLARFIGHAARTPGFDLAAA